MSVSGIHSNSMRHNWRLKKIDEFYSFFRCQFLKTITLFARVYNCPRRRTVEFFQNNLLIRATRTNATLVRLHEHIDHEKFNCQIFISQRNSNSNWSFIFINVMKSKAPWLKQCYCYTETQNGREKSDKKWTDNGFICFTFWIIMENDCQKATAVSLQTICPYRLCCAIEGIPSWIWYSKAMRLKFFRTTNHELL